MDTNKIKKGLGRGLSSLIGETKAEININKVSISDLVSNKFQPRKIFDEEVILKEYKSNNNDATAEMIKMESTRFQRAHTIIAVLSSPVEHPKICEWEQILSAGAMCTTILYAAQSLGYASQWITEWYAYKKNVILALGGDPVKDKVAGFIYIGEKDRDPKERVRPAPKDYISYF